MDDYYCVYQFHQIFRSTIHNRPSSIVLDDQRLVDCRLKLINEELNELCGATTLTETIDAVADLIYVIYGLSIALGLPFESIQPNEMIANCSCDQVGDKLKTTVSDLAQVIQQHDWSRIKQTISHLLTICYHYGQHRLQIDVSQAINLVHQSNLTKLCQTKEEAIQSVQWYVDHLSNRYHTPSYRPTIDGHHWVIYDQATSKVLKGLSFIEPQWSKLLIGGKPI